MRVVVFACQMTQTTRAVPYRTHAGLVPCRLRKQQNLEITFPATGLVLESTHLLPMAALHRAIDTYLNHHDGQGVATVRPLALNTTAHSDHRN